jgi:hypothetical protein
MKTTGDTIVLDSGKEIYANNGVIGIDSDFNLYSGSDGVILDHKWYDPSIGNDLTPEEVVEIADFIICKFERLKQKMLNNKNISTVEDK